MPKKKILCHINKVVQAFMLPLPQFRFIEFYKKHHNYANKKTPIYYNIYFCCHIFVTTHHKIGLTYLAKFVKFLQAFMSPPPSPIL